jgi:2-succinyl-5-enolpyruvyl-6-hydroxy-3-cyclohexene-1-carboxylate synthase
MDMQDSNRPVYQVLVNIAELCYQKGMTALVLSPGSRSAPLAITFWRHGGFECRVVPDERSAAYQALGMASATGKPVGLVCTSGTAPLNYTPAIAEAYWQRIPLVAFTADRPPEWIGQGENQSIHQQDIYAANSKGFFELPPALQLNSDKQYAYQQVNAAINMACTAPSGPVQVNVPFREPLYPESTLPRPEADIPIHEKVYTKPGLSDTSLTALAQAINRSTRILVVAGMGAPSEEELQVLGEFIRQTHAVLVTDLLANAHHLPEAVTAVDVIAKKAKDQERTHLQPELLITFGGPLLSKAVKQFLRAHKPAEHWHVSEAGEERDTFQALTKVVATDPFTFFQKVAGKLQGHSRHPYTQAWHQLEEQVSAAIADLDTAEGAFSEIRALRAMLWHLPEEAVLHLGNSLPVRHIQLLAPLVKDTKLLLKANRGTSGIDGCLSAAVGYAKQTSLPVYTILGDLAFMYDRNALWLDQLPDNLFIIILNNSGGGVFRTLPGAKDQPELEDYFASAQHTHFHYTAYQHGCPYLYADNWSSFHENLNHLGAQRKAPLILELSFHHADNFQDQSAIHADLAARLSPALETGKS